MRNSESLRCAIAAGSLRDCHERFGYVLVDAIRTMAYESRQEPSNRWWRGEFLLWTMRGRKAELSGVSEEWAEAQPGSRWIRPHGRSYGRFETRSLSSALHFVLFKDNATRYCWWSSCRASRRWTQKTVKNYMRQIERQTGRKLRTIRSDNGGEYIAKTMKNFVKNEDINHQWLSAHVSQQNDRIEREMRTIVESARSMLKARDLSNVLWAEAVAAVYILNRTVNQQSDDSKTPFEAWFRFRSSVATIRLRRVFDDSGGYSLDAKSRVTFVSYSEMKKNFRLFDRERHKMFVSCNIKFNETKTTPIHGWILRRTRD